MSAEEEKKLEDVRSTFVSLVRSVRNGMGNDGPLHKTILEFEKTLDYSKTELESAGLKSDERAKWQQFFMLYHNLWEYTEAFKMRG